MTEAEKYAMRLIFPRHIADRYILYGKSLKDIDTFELKHAQMRKEAEEREREKQQQEMFTKQIQEIAREELQKAMQKWLDK